MAKKTSFPRQRRAKSRPRRRVEADIDLLGALILAPAWLVDRVYSWIKRKRAGKGQDSLTSDS